MGLRRPLVCLGAFALAACEPVPDIRFVPDDAGEGPVVDGGDDDVPKDAASPFDAPQTGCPGDAPPGGVCCGSVWCVGDRCGQACGDCEQKCGAGQQCCPKPGTVLCKEAC